MNHDDRIAIEGLFERLAEVERRSPPRDREAERLIAAEMSRQPAAPYYMAQTILVQEQALEAAEERIRQLEDAVAERREGRSRGPWDSDHRRSDEGRGGGFLAGAAQTALGVSGGLLLGSAIGSLLGFGASPAQAADPAPAAEPVADEPPADDGGDFGGDFGGFDLGGDF